MPKVSIIIPTFNRSKKLVRALESVFEQAFTDYEVVVVDDGSTDGTSEAISSFQERVRYLYQENQGVSAARNRGIQEAQGEWIAFLDSDDTWLATKLEKQMSFLAANPHVSILACLAENEVPHFRYQNPHSSEEQFLTFLLTPFSQNMSRYVIRKECFERGGGFDGRLQGPEDWELLLRFLKNGYEFDFVPEPLIRYDPDGLSISGNPSRMLEGERMIKERYVDTLSDPLKRADVGSRFLARSYFSAAWSYEQVGNRRKAFEWILKSLLCNFFWPRTLDRLKLLGSIVLRNFLKGVLGVGIPAPRMIWRPIYYLRLAVLSLFCGLRKVLWCEPLLRAYCRSSGRNLEMSEFVPYITGQGDLYIGDRVRIGGKLNLSFNSRYHKHPAIRIGNDVFLGHNTSIVAAQEVTVGDRCYLASETKIWDIDGHPIDAEKRKKGLPPAANQIKPVRIGSNVWIGHGVLILKGVTVGENSIIGAGSVVTRDIPADSVAAGNPAKVVRSLEKGERTGRERAADIPASIAKGNGHQGDLLL